MSEEEVLVGGIGAEFSSRGTIHLVDRYDVRGPLSHCGVSIVSGCPTWYVSAQAAPQVVNCARCLPALKEK